MADGFDFQTRKPRRLPDVDPSVRRRFESMELGRRRPGERLRAPRADEDSPFVIPRGDSLPPERSHRLRWGLMLTGVLALLVIVHGIWSGRPLWTAQQVRVQGNRAVQSEDVLAALRVESGMPWWRVLTSDRSSLLDTEPRIQTVGFRYQFPQGLLVRVTERTPVLRWLGDPVRVVAEDGVLLAGISGLDPSDLPCLSAPGFDPGLPGRQVEFPGTGEWWSQLLRVKEENGDLWATISQVQYEGERRFRVFFRDPKRVVVWDPFMNAHLWSRIPMVLDDLASRGLGTDAVLDLRFRDRIVVRVPEEEWQRLRDGTELGESQKEESTGGPSSRKAQSGDRGGRT